MDRAPLPAAFDPWASSADDAMVASEMRQPGQPDPLAQYELAQRVLSSHGECLSPGGGFLVAHLVALCAVTGVQPPHWLAAENLRRLAMVASHEVASLDLAFGHKPLGPKRLVAARTRSVLKRQVHGLVWEMAGPGSELPIGEDLFASISQRVSVSPSRVSKLYYAALRDGMPNVASLRPRAVAELPEKRLHSCN